MGPLFPLSPNVIRRGGTLLELDEEVTLGVTREDG